MAGITLETAQTQLDTWIAAETKVAAGQQVDINGKRLTRANLADIRASIEFWDRQCKRLDRGKIRMVPGVPTDG